MMRPLLIKSGRVVTLDPQNRILSADLLIEDGRITAIAQDLPVQPGIETIDARRRIVLPGFVQTHVHLCQTIFRGTADDLSLIEWLREQIWPREAGLTPETLALSARLGIAEMIRGGTTTALTMESVNHTNVVFEEAFQSGFRATIGKCMMDLGADVPPTLREERHQALAESEILLRRWHGEADGRIRYCLAPRFAVSCSRELLEETARLARRYGVLVHTHASENRAEIELVRELTGLRNIEYLHQVGLTGPGVVLAHCIHLNQEEMEILRSTSTRVAHCPSSNLKLGSGIARVVEMIQSGIEVSLGADGAPCNNRLEMFTEMRTAALLQKSLHGPQVMSALQVLRMATIGGAQTLGLADEIGSIEVGKRADLQILDLDELQTLPHPDPISTIVYAADSRNVETVIIDGRVVMSNRELTTIDEKSLIRALASDWADLNP